MRRVVSEVEHRAQALEPRQPRASRTREDDETDGRPKPHHLPDLDQEGELHQGNDDEEEGEFGQDAHSEGVPRGIPDRSWLVSLV